MNNELNVGNKVCVVSLPSFLKTAEPMPMLRSSDLIAVGEEGIIIDRRPAGYWGVKFNRGAFLIESKHIEKTDNC
jgi:Protein of unknown function (DUF3148)